MSRFGKEPFMHRLPWLSLLVIASTAPQLRAQSPPALHDTTAYAATAIPLRAKPAVNAQIVDSLAAGAKVRVHACADGWCTVTATNRSGYVESGSLSLEPPHQTAPQGRGYVNSKGQWVPSPTRSLSNKPPAGATARCRDGTYSFSRSRRGTCSHHGGVARWL